MAHNDRLLHALTEFLENSWVSNSLTKSWWTQLPPPHASFSHHPHFPPWALLAVPTSLHLSQHLCPQWYPEMEQTPALLALFFFRQYAALASLELTNRLGSPACLCLNHNKPLEHILRWGIVEKILTKTLKVSFHVCTYTLIH